MLWEEWRRPSKNSMVLIRMQLKLTCSTGKKLMMSLPEQIPFKMQLLSDSRLGLMERLIANRLHLMAHLNDSRLGLMELLTGSRLGLTVPLRSNSQLDSTKPLITVLNKQWIKVVSAAQIGTPTCSRRAARPATPSTSHSSEHASSRTKDSALRKPHCSQWRTHSLTSLTCLQSVTT